MQRLLAPVEVPDINSYNSPYSSILQSKDYNNILFITDQYCIRPSTMLGLGLGVGLGLGLGQ